ncbi:protein-L-isoaspartate(D-aspartate) O-methyltransferase [Elusimicrobiota bacterium]
MKRNNVLFLAIIIFSFGFFACESGNEQEESKLFKAKRKNMVEKQIKGRGVFDERVLNALLKVERHKFVPFREILNAYDDRPLPIGDGQTISQPYIVGIMTELLQLKGGETVLEIGTGSGYQAAVLAELCDKVYTIEIVESLGLRSKNLIERLGYKNVEVKIGDGYLGWPEHAPFDGIIVTCAPPNVPDVLIEQLKDGGRMVIPVGEFYQKLIVIKKENGQITKEDVIPVRFVPMVKGRKK